MILAYLLFLDQRNSKRVDTILSKIVLVALTVIAGIRYDVGVDYLGYEHGFYMQSFEINEPLYWLLNKIVWSIDGEFYWITLIMAFLTNIFIYLGLKKRYVSCRGVTLGLLLFACTGWTATFNLIRQGVAVAIFFYASIYIREKNLKKYLCWMIIGAGFHNSILLLLPLYFFKRYKIGIIVYLGTVIMVYGIVYSGSSRGLLNYLIKFINGYSGYSGSSHIMEAARASGLGVMLNVILSVIIMIFCSRKIDNEKFNNEKNYYLFGIILSILAIDTYMYGRIGMYFSIFSVIVIPIAIQTIKDKNLKFVIGFILIMSIFLLYGKETFSPSPASKLEYKTIFTHKPSITYR